MIFSRAFGRHSKTIDCTHFSSKARRVSPESPVGTLKQWIEWVPPECPVGTLNSGLYCFFREEMKNRRCSDDFGSDRRKSVWAVKLHVLHCFVHQKPSLFACDFEICFYKIKLEKLGTRRAERLDEPEKDPRNPSRRPSQRLECFKKFKMFL